MHFAPQHLPMMSRAVFLRKRRRREGFVRIVRKKGESCTYLYKHPKNNLIIRQPAGISQGFAMCRRKMLKTKPLKR